MRTRELLEVIPRGKVVKVRQEPITRIDSGKEPVLRQYGEVSVLLGSGQNYLDFEVTRLGQEAGILCVLCKADAEQEARTVAARYEGR